MEAVEYKKKIISINFAISSLYSKFWVFLNKNGKYSNAANEIANVFQSVALTCSKPNKELSFINLHGEIIPIRTIMQ